jgi:rubrerythrin
MGGLESGVSTDKLRCVQERISKLENVHRDSVEQLVRERVSVHLGALAERAQGDTEEVQQLQVQLREQNGQLEAASQQIAELEAQIANVRLSRNAHSVGQKSPSPKKNVHRNPNASPSVSCNDSQEPHSEEVTMQMATAEVNSSVAKLVDVLHTELRERAASHSAIMTAIANTVAMRCSSVPPSDELHDGGKYLQKIQPIPVISRSPPASFVVQQDTDASDKSTSSQRCSYAKHTNMCLIAARSSLSVL